MSFEHVCEKQPCPNLGNLDTQDPRKTSLKGFFQRMIIELSKRESLRQCKRWPPNIFPNFQSKIIFNFSVLFNTWKSMRSKVLLERRFHRLNAKVWILGRTVIGLYALGFLLGSISNSYQIRQLPLIYSSLVNFSKFPKSFSFVYHLKINCINL